MPQMPRPADRLMRFLLRLFPFDFRSDHGREIEQTFLAQQRDAEREGSRISLWRLWGEFIAGIFTTAPREHLSILRQDVSYALRRISQSPGFTFLVVLTLALGVGANTAIFSVVNGVLLRPLPYGEGKRLLLLRQVAPGFGVQDAGFSEKEINDYTAQNSTLDGLVEYHSMTFILIDKEPYRVQTGVVSPEYFDFFGVRPLYGRTFRVEDNVQGAPGVLMLSYRFWQRTFGGDPRVVNRALRMNDRPHTVIGILPPLPGFPDDNDVYMPVADCPFRSNPKTRADRNARMSTVFARLKPGASLEQVRSDVATISARLGVAYPQTYPKNSGFSASASFLKEELTSNARPTFLILLATAGFVLLIACANVANLTLSRMMHRERELAIRAALGANRSRLMRQLLTESTLLAVAGGALGLVMASFSTDLLVRFASRFTPRTGDIAIDTNVLLFTLGVSVLTGLVFGSLPAVSAGSEIVNSLKEGGGHAPAGSRRLRARNFLVVAQVAMSLVLLAGAGLMLRSFMKLLQVSPGFRPENVLAARISTSFSKYSDPDVHVVQLRYRNFYDRVLHELDGRPDIIAKAFASSYPMMPSATPQAGRRIQIDGKPVAEGQPQPRAEFHTVTPEYFRAVGIPLIHGRVFDAHDNAESPRVGVISQAMADYYWPGEDPLGKEVGFGDPPTWVQVVGIVGDVKEYGPGEKSPIEIYQPLAQDGFVNRVLVRTTADPMRVAEVVRKAILSVDPDAPLDQFRTLEQVHSESVAAPRLTAVLLSIFGALALVITATGISGVLALSVSQRRHEIGVRMALGASPGSVLSMVLRQGMKLVLAGVALGVAGAFALTGVLSKLLFGIQPYDAATFVGVILVLVGVAAAACWLPARRAASINPISALRTE